MMSGKMSFKLLPILVFTILIVTGTITFILALIAVSTILALIGLGSLFWGTILIYIRTEEYVKKPMLDAIGYSEVKTINQIITKLGYGGPAVYLPPKYFTNPEDQMIYVPKQEGDVLSIPDQLQILKTDSFIITTNGMLLIPPGIELVKLFERTLEINFASVEIEFLEQNLQRLFVENLEIAQSIDLEVKKEQISVKLEKSIYKVLNFEGGQPIIGSPISSAIACVLAKTTGKLVTIKSQRTNENDKNITLEYQFIN
jgi:hypothetical protein